MPVRRGDGFKPTSHLLGVRVGKSIFSSHSSPLPSHFLKLGGSLNLPQVRAASQHGVELKPSSRIQGPEFKHLTVLGLSFFICKIKG